MGEYTKEQLDLMSPAEICEIALELDIIHLDDLIQDILTVSDLKKECESLLDDIYRREPGGRGRHHLEVKLRDKLARLTELEKTGGAV